ncbi:MAG: VWA domain-containing protein [Candidatus Melainabacteria bacterium]|nr:VWA domain-containing protein [Candidatus Melainabacteria bacterium]
MRKPSGQVAIALNLVIAIFVIGSLGIATYELTRVLLAREQLKNCLEFAALAGTASLASSSASGAPATTEAKAVALNMFKMNSILGQPLASSVREVASLSQLNPQTASVDMFVEFDDPITKQPTANASNVMRLADLLTYFFSRLGGDPAEAQTPPAYNPWGADATMFTDVVVNIDGNPTYGGTVVNGISVPDYRWLVEAARGNLENGGVAPNAIAPLAGTPMEGAANPGFRSAYRVAAYSKLEPKGTLERSVKGFITKVAETSDCHFGFVAYNNRAGTSPTDTDKAQRISWAYPVAGKVKYLVPAIPLDPNADNIASVSALLSPPANDNNPMYVPNGGSNLADGLQQAYNMLTGTGSRTGAMKAVIVVTDKVPTRDLAGTVYSDPTANGPAIADAVNVAKNLGKKGIPIFMVGIDHAGGQMTPFMLEQFSDTAAGGVVYTAGHGGVLHTTKWVDPQTTLNALNGKFNNIVRQLVVLNRG